MLNSVSESQGFLPSLTVLLVVSWEISLHHPRILFVSGLGLGFLGLPVQYLNPSKPWFCECLTSASVPNSSSTLNLLLKCFTSRNVFPVCQAAKSSHQQVFTTPANSLSGGESLSFYHKRLGEWFSLLSNVFSRGFLIINLLLNCCDKNEVFSRWYSSMWVGCQGTRAELVARVEQKMPSLRN